MPEGTPEGVEIAAEPKHTNHEGEQPARPSVERVDKTCLTPFGTTLAQGIALAKVNDRTSEASVGPVSGSRSILVKADSTRWRAENSTVTWPDHHGQGELVQVVEYVPT